MIDSSSDSVARTPLRGVVWVWQWPSSHTWGWVVVVAFCGTYSHYCYARAMQHAEATVVVPMDFLRVPLTAGVGWLAYAERVDVYTAVGVGLILGGNVLNLLRGSVRTASTKSIS